VTHVHCPNTGWWVIRAISTRSASSVAWWNARAENAPNRAVSAWVTRAVGPSSAASAGTSSAIASQLGWSTSARAR